MTRISRTCLRRDHFAKLKWKLILCSCEELLLPLCSYFCWWLPIKMYQSSLKEYCQGKSVQCFFTYNIQEISRHVNIFVNENNAPRRIYKEMTPVELEVSWQLNKENTFQTLSSFHFFNRVLCSSVALLQKN